MKSASLTFNDPDHFQERIRPAEVELTPLAGGPFHATLSQTELGSLTLQHTWQSLPVIARCALHKSRNTIIFQTGTDHTGARVNGIDLTPHIFGLFCQGEEHFLHTSPDAACATLTLTSQTYATAREVLIGDHFNPVLRTCLVRPGGAAMTRLQALHQEIRTAFAARPDHPVHPQVAKTMEQALLTALIDCIAGHEDMSGAPRGMRRSTAVMRRLYELLDASDGLPLSLLDVCTQLGVPRRTLHNACVEHIGLSPHRFLWLRRMNLTRQALLRADPACTTVTQIATKAGFWELGRFSVNYKRLYGESPSVTLARSDPPVRRAA